MNETALAARRTGTAPVDALQFRVIRQTGFYPLYDGENDQVDAIEPVGRARFQRVVPRYRLSSSETSDSGLGPTFYEIPVLVPAPRARGAVLPADLPASGPERFSGAGGPVVSPLQPWQGNQVDFYA